MTVLDLISTETRIPVDHLKLIARTADHRYKLYTIPKRAGGVRLIAHPARELKFLQRWIVANIFSHAKIHDRATAYQVGASAQRNAELHATARYFLKLDFEEFFPSILKEDVVNLLERFLPNLKIVLSKEDVDLTSKIVTRYGKLTIGAPSSPIVSNAIMYDFDVGMVHLATRFACTYSRYADDIVFSTIYPNTLEQVLREVRDRVGVLVSPRLRINEKKVVFTSKKRRVRVTGLVITPENRISVGRTTKRKIKALVHQFLLGKLSDDGKGYVSGYLAYLRGADPMFFAVLENKYGVDAVRMLLHLPPIRRKKIYDQEKGLFHLLMLQQEFGPHRDDN